MSFLSEVAGRFGFKTSTDTVVATKTPGKPAVGIYEEQAISMMVSWIGKMPDPDEVLKQAGLKRNALRTLLYDDEIAQCCDTRFDAITRTPMRFEPSDTPQAKFLEEMIGRHKEPLLSGCFMARMFGYSVMETVYNTPEENGTPYIGIKTVGEKPLEWFEPMSDGTLRWYPENGIVPPGAQHGTDVKTGATYVICDQQFKYLLTRVKATYKNPFGEALLSRLYWPWYFRSNGWKFWAKFLERFGTPLLVGESGDPEAMVNALIMSQSSGAMGINIGDKVVTVGTGGQGAETFSKFEENIVRRMQKLVLGQTLTSGTDGGSGNRALGQVHNDVRDDKRLSDIGLITTTLQRLVDALCELNGFAPHKVVFADEQGLEADRAARDQILYNQGIRFTEEYYNDNYGFNPGDFEMASANAPVDGNGNPIDPNADPNADPKKPGDPSQPPKNKSNLPPKKGAKLSDTLAFIRRRTGSKFTRQQQQVEDIGDDLVDQDLHAISPEVIRSAVLAANDPQDLEDRLFALIGDTATAAEFSEWLEQALFTADVLGYVHAEGKVD